MTESNDGAATVSGGTLVVDALARHGVDALFTLSGAHIFPIYDGCVARDIRLFDVRHEQTAAFAAEGYAKLTRRPGVAAVTAGPGVTNCVSAVTTAAFNGSPLVLLGGRAAQAGWGRGALQEFDHVPVLEPVTKYAATASSTEGIAGYVDAAVVAAATPHRGPAFLDLPMDLLFGHAPSANAGTDVPAPVEADAAEVSRAAELLSGAARPLLICGSDVYWDGAWDALGRLVDTIALPVVANGLGRGCLPADHACSFSRARSAAFKGADLVIVAGTPLDFRIGFGRFGADGATPVVHVVDAVDDSGPHPHAAVTVAGDIGLTFDALARAVVDRGAPDTASWLDLLRADEERRRADEAAQLADDSSPVKPSRVYGEVRKVLDRDAVVICDGGDFVSYAGKYVDSYAPGLWMDPGPFGCLGTGLGYAMAARIAHPDRQVVMFMGDGGFGFSGMDFDSLVRLGLPVVAVVGNNGIWGLEKHPMRALYGYDVVADLQPECRYDEVVAALGGHGEFVTTADGIVPAMQRAFDSGLPALVNIATDPADMYPRSSNLA